MLEAMRCPPGQHQGLEPHAKHGPAPTTLNLGGRAQGPPQTPLSGIPNTFVGSFPTMWHCQAPRIQRGPKRNGGGGVVPHGAEPPTPRCWGTPGVGVAAGWGWGRPWLWGTPQGWGDKGLVTGGGYPRGSRYGEDWAGLELGWGLSAQRPFVLGRPVCPEILDTGRTGVGVSTPEALVTGRTGGVVSPQKSSYLMTGGQLPHYWEHWGGGSHP